MPQACSELLLRRERGRESAGRACALQCTCSRGRGRHVSTLHLRPRGAVDVYFDLELVLPAPLSGDAAAIIGSL